VTALAEHQLRMLREARPGSDADRLRRRIEAGEEPYTPPVAPPRK
jgi:hypothetical protein